MAWSMYLGPQTQIPRDQVTPEGFSENFGRPSPGSHSNPKETPAPSIALQPPPEASSTVTGKDPPCSRKQNVLLSP